MPENSCLVRGKIVLKLEFIYSSKSMFLPFIYSFSKNRTKQDSRKVNEVWKQ